jgi:hypothetical protein
VGGDQFVFDKKPSSANKDTISDFNVKDDTLRLDNGIFTKAGVNGYLKAGAFWTSNTGKAHDRMIGSSTTRTAVFSTMMRTARIGQGGGVHHDLEEPVDDVQRYLRDLTALSARRVPRFPVEQKALYGTGCCRILAPVSFECTLV